jgi:nitrilase
MAPRRGRIAALQIGSSPEGTAATLTRIMGYRQEIADQRIDLLVLPEAVLGGYPKGADFGARMGYRVPAGRDAFLGYWEQSVAMDGPEIAELGDLAKDTDTALVVGVIEREGATLYCTAVFITADGTLAGYHRKLMPTGTERLVWGQAQDAGLTTMETRAGRAGAAICWENYMPLYRSALYSQGIDIWCAPTVDEREIWQVSMRHIAYEARCFVVSACQYQPPATTALSLPITLRDRPEGQQMIGGGSVVISPMGEIIAGPLLNGEGLVVADIDLDDIIRARFDLDVSGHYARPDLFSLSVG